MTLHTVTRNRQHAHTHTHKLTHDFSWIIFGFPDLFGFSRFSRWAAILYNGKLC